MAEAAGPKLILAGFGSSSALQLTVEAQQMAVHIGQVVSLNLPERLRALLARQGVTVTPLDDRFAGKPFAEGYAAVAQAVLSRAEKDPPAMFISQGSPLLVNAITRFLVAEATRLEMPLRVFPGVSPVDVVVAELGIDVGRSGLLTISAAGLLARPVALNPRIPLLVLELAGVRPEDASAEAYGPLVELLQAEYPQDQAITLVNMAGDGGITRSTVTLENFAQLLPNIEPSSCLFIDIRRRAKAAETA